jgi:hypothetical protein
MAKSNRFSALRNLREQRQEEETQDIRPVDPVDVEQPESTEQDGETEQNSENEVSDPAPLSTQKADEQAKADQPAAQNESQKRKLGRPRGRRSNPDYTQVSAYIPLELLLEVQDELAEERREKLQRTPRPVSDLMEELLSEWLKKRKRKKSSS